MQERKKERKKKERKKSEYFKEKENRKPVMFGQMLTIEREESSNVQ